MELETDNLPEFQDLTMNLKQLEEVNIMDHLDKMQEYAQVLHRYTNRFR